MMGSTMRPALTVSCLKTPPSFLMERRRADTSSSSVSPVITLISNFSVYILFYSILSYRLEIMLYMYFGTVVLIYRTLPSDSCLWPQHSSIKVSLHSTLSWILYYCFLFPSMSHAWKAFPSECKINIFSSPVAVTHSLLICLALSPFPSPSLQPGLETWMSLS